METFERSGKLTSGGGGFLPLLFFIAATFAVFGRILGHEFLYNWDDNVYVTANEAIRGFTLPHLKNAFTSFYVGNFAPLHIVSYMVDYSLWGLNPRGYLLVNLLLHGVNAFLAYTLYLRLGGGKWISFLAATLFLVHPVQVETVAWVSERKTLLAMFFFLLSINCYIRYRAESAGSRAGWYLLCLLCFSASLLSKAVAVILPLVLISHDLYRGGWKLAKKKAADKIPFFAVSALFTVVTLLGQRSADRLSEYAGGSFLSSTMTMLPVFSRYLGNIFWPTGLGPIYKPQIMTSPDVVVLLSLFLLTVVVLAAFILLRRQKATGFALSLFLLGLLPVAHIFPLATLMQDRYLYFPMLGGTFFVVVLMVNWTEAVGGERSVRICLVFLCMLVLVAGVASFYQAGYWKNALSLWTRAVQVQPDSKQAWLMLANTCHDEKDLAGAERAYLGMLKIAPRDTMGLNGIGILYGEMGDLDKALDYLGQAVRIEPDNPETLINYGYAAFLKGNLSQSRESLIRAAVLVPAKLEMLLPVLLDIARKQGDPEEVQRLESLMRRGE